MQYFLSNKILLTSLFQRLKFRFKLFLQVYTFMQIFIRVYSYE